ncbi:hypothetical protein EAY22_26895, partial [Vibrio anguillarum]|nr:hypothetical protein [Vibrio anguillarum]
NNSKPLRLLKAEMTISERYGFLLWYVNRYGDIENISFESFIEYCGAWPTPLWQDLDALKEKAELVRVKDWKKIFFNEAFGALLKDCRQLPSRQLSRNAVLTQVLAYFTKLMAM